MTPIEQVRESVTHELKCHPEPFQAVKRNEKRFEFRKDDRDYRVGDNLHLREWMPGSGWDNDGGNEGDYTGDECHRRVDYIIREGFGIPNGYCIMSLSLLKTMEGEPVAISIRQDVQTIDMLCRIHKVIQEFREPTRKTVFYCPVGGQAERLAELHDELDLWLKTETIRATDPSPQSDTLIVDRLAFGHYCWIEQYRYRAEGNEIYQYKVIGQLKSNSYVNVPVRSGTGHYGDEELLHDEVVPVVACICCGVGETKVRKFRLTDVRLNRELPTKAAAK